MPIAELSILGSVLWVYRSMYNMDDSWQLGNTRNILDPAYSGSRQQVAERGQQLDSKGGY